MTTQRATSKQKYLPAHATTKVVIYVFVTVTSTRFRATVQTTYDGSQPLLTGAWESLSHRCRLPVQAKAVQTPDTSFVLVSPA